jgi:transcriptional regulator with XRE-family HTH domain
VDRANRRRAPGPLGKPPASLSAGRAALVAELRTGREKAKLSLHELGQQVFSSKASVSRWLNGQSIPTRDQAKRWAEVCGTEVAVMVALWDAAVAESTDRSEVISSGSSSSQDSVRAYHPHSAVGPLNDHAAIRENSVGPPAPIAVPWWQAAKSPRDGDSRLLAAAEGLARAVQRQWEAEEALRRVHDPFPLPLRWVNAPESLVDHWENIRGDGSNATPIPLDGHLGEIVDVYQRIPSGRLVVLGQAGAGKTILALRFTLSLLNRGDIVTAPAIPVIFAMASWDPSRVPFRAWIVEQLTTTYPGLAARAGDTTLAAALFENRQILPILDGFDELAEGLRPQAITSLNAALQSGDRFVLTSRPEPYAAAIDAANDVLTAAAVVQLQDLELRELAAYLPRTTRKTADQPRTTKWTPVLNRLADDSDDPAAAVVLTVLSTPLMVGLARTIYSDTAASPDELLDPTRFPTRETVEEHLLDAFVPTVYSQLLPQGPGKLTSCPCWVWSA